jgi:hypothetical protein
MAVSAYEVISTQTLGSAAATVTFSSIPQTYTDLVFVISSGVTTGTYINFYHRYNGSSSALYSRTTLYGDGSTAASARATGATEAYSGLSETTIQSTTTIHLFNYSNTTTFKTCLTRDTEAALIAQSRINLWRSTDAISSVDFVSASSTFIAGSTFTLYGIRAA